MTLKTPECPEGRDLIVLANDITYMIGSFSVKEDMLFKVGDTDIEQFNSVKINSCLPFAAGKNYRLLLGCLLTFMLGLC